ncbi:MAG: glycosyltransferase family 4 protein [Lewinella sp.]|uniref:glycosyltransferase family 4 protein n=1 Tax=Lewinella sp. TaxID=2004506 RepID=UPI003D6C6364
MQPSILLVSNSAFNILHFRRSLWRMLLQEGYNVIALAPADGKEKLLEKAGLRFIDLSSLQQYGNGPVSDVLLYKTLVRKYGDLRPDLILHFTIKPNIYGSVAAQKVGIPSIATITGLGTTWLNGVLLRKITQALYRFSLPASNVIVGQNAHDLESLQKIGVKAKEWQLIPGSGIDMDEFAPNDLVVSSPAKHFLFLGRMLIDKGLEELFNAWHQIHHLLPDAHLHLVGELDRQHPRCIPEKIWTAGIDLPRVAYHGYQENVRQYIGRSQVVILPSYREGIPRSLLESMSMGKPIIATDVPGCRELAVPRKTGWRVPARSSAALAEAILQASRSKPEELSQLGNNGRKLVQEGYSETIVAQQYLEIIQDLLG